VKYRISVLDEATLNERLHIRLNGWGAIVVVALTFLLTMGIFSLVILYTPVKNYLPGYSEDIRQNLMIESSRVDSIGTSLELQRQYLGVIKQVMAGEVQSDTVQSLDSMQIIMREQLLEAKNEATAEFIAQYEAKEKNNMLLFEDIKTQQNTKTVFFVPVHGAIVQHFSLQDMSFGVRINTIGNENIASALDGGIIYVNQEINDVYTMMVKHTDYLFVYRGIKKPLRKIGDKVEAGECIGIASEGQMGFEIWRNDQALDPEKLIAF
jgi:uncharacterized protein YuzE